MSASVDLTLLQYNVHDGVKQGDHKWVLPSYENVTAKFENRMKDGTFSMFEWEITDEVVASQASSTKPSITVTPTAD